MTETKCQKKLIERLDAAGALCFKVHGHAMQRRGWPDLQVYSKIWTGLLELKWGKGGLSALQKDKIEELKARNANVFVVRFVDMTDAQVEDETGKVLLTLQEWKKWTGTNWLRLFQGSSEREDR